MNTIGAIAIGAAVGFVVSRTPYFRKPDLKIGGDKDPYMLRWHLIPQNKYLSVYLHKFLHSDYDDGEHDHPYDNISVVLSGGYMEHMSKVRYIRRPGAVVFRRAEQSHRVELFWDHVRQRVVPAWSLFICGRRRRKWGFYCPQGWRPWDAFTDAQHYGVRIRNCEDIT